jgi:alkanesulfonate monooxygenase SsuD/methylene tetrahydromethanopterin reductase-like flavin-dependent oxidoreductase (luciferase family)
MWPKPRQHPRPPILVGGYGPRVLERVLEYGDGWMPFRVEPDDPRAGSNEPEEFDADLARRIADLHRRGDACGRGRLPVTLFNAKPQRDALRRYDDIGVARCIFHLPSVGPGEMEQQLASLADVAGLK